MELLSIHQNFEPVLRLIPAQIGINTEQELLAASFNLSLRLPLLLLQLRFFVDVTLFICLLVVVLPLLDDGLGDDLCRCRICDCILRHYDLVVAHLDLREWRRCQAQLDRFLLGLLFCEPVPARQLLLFLSGEEYW